MSSYAWMGKENVVYTHTADYFSAIKKKDQGYLLIHDW